MNHRIPMDNLNAMGTLLLIVIALCVAIRLVWLLTRPFARMEDWLDRLPDRIADTLMKPVMEKSEAAINEARGSGRWRLTDDGWEDF